jgi:hypothetical protein
MVAPISIARSKARNVFSGSYAEAPLWATLCITYSSPLASPVGEALYCLLTLIGSPHTMRR